MPARAPQAVERELQVGQRIVRLDVVVALVLWEACVCFDSLFAGCTSGVSLLLRETGHEDCFLFPDYAWVELVCRSSQPSLLQHVCTLHTLCVPSHLESQDLTQARLITSTSPFTQPPEPPEPLTCHITCSVLSPAPLPFLQPPELPEPLR
eukprot:1145798-Pelagomonas_calceolata.AAC.6